MEKTFGNKAFYKSALMIALPVMLQGLIQNLVSLIDNFMVAGLGDIKMSGVNICGQIIFAFLIIFNGVCSSGGIYLTQYFGAKDSKGMKQAVSFKYITCLFVLIVFSVSCFIFPREVLSIMVRGNAQASEILDEGVKYMFIFGFCGVPIMVSTIIATSFREIGEVKVPLTISAIATLINTFFNYLLIYGNFNAPRLEVRGAAIATVIAKVSEMIMFIIYQIKSNPEFRIKLKQIFSIDRDLYKTILNNSWMILFSDAAWALCETITTALYNGRGGADVVSGMSASFAIANLYFIAFNGVYTATSVIVGKRLGEGKLLEAKKEAKWLLNGSFIFGIFMLAFALNTSALVPIVFAKLSISSQTICKNMVIGMACFMPIWIYSNVQFAISRSGGDTKMGAWIDGIATFVIIIPMLLYMTYYTNIGPVEMYIITKCVDFFKIIFAFFWLRKEIWLKNLAEENKTN